MLEHYLIREIVKYNEERKKLDSYIYIYINIYIYRKVLSDERLGVKLRVTENQCVLFDSLTYIYSALLPQH